MENTDLILQEDLKLLDKIEFNDILNKKKELRKVTVTIGLSNVPVNDIKRRNAKKGKKALRHTGNDNYIMTKTGFIFHNVKKVTKATAHLTKINR